MEDMHGLYMCTQVFLLLSSSIVFYINKRLLISQRQVLLTMALRRQMFLFASVTCAQEAEAEAERCGASYKADDSLYRDDFQADGRGSWLYLLLS